MNSEKKNEFTIVFYYLNLPDRQQSSPQYIVFPKALIKYRRLQFDWQITIMLEFIFYPNPAVINVYLTRLNGYRGCARSWEEALPEKQNSENTSPSILQLCCGAALSLPRSHDGSKGHFTNRANWLRASGEPLAHRLLLFSSSRDVSKGPIRGLLWVKRHTGL